MKNHSVIAKSAVTLLLALTSGVGRAEVNISQINDHIKLLPKVRAKFAQTIESEKVTGELDRLLSLSDSKIVAMTLDYLNETTAKSTEVLSTLSAEQKRLLLDKRRELLKSESPAVRLLAFRSLVAQSYASNDAALFNELKAGIAKEPESKIRELMSKQVGLRTQDFRDLQIVIPSAVWCAPCKHLKEEFKKENFPSEGILKMNVHGRSMDISYRIVDVDEESGLYESLLLSNMVPSVNLVKNGYMFDTAFFSSSGGRPLSPAGFRATVEAVLKSYLD